METQQNQRHDETVVEPDPHSNGQSVVQPIDFEESEIVINVKGGKYDGKTLTFDSFSVQLIVEEMLDNHPEIKMTDDEASQAFGDKWEPGLVYYRRSPKWLKKLSDEIEEACGACTPAIADRLWKEVGRIEHELKKNTDETQS